MQLPQYGSALEFVGAPGIGRRKLLVHALRGPGGRFTEEQRGNAHSASAATARRVASSRVESAVEHAIQLSWGDGI